MEECRAALGTAPEHLRALDEAFARAAVDGRLSTAADSVAAARSLEGRLSGISSLVRSGSTWVMVG